MRSVTIASLRGVILVLSGVSSIVFTGCATHFPKPPEESIQTSSVKEEEGDITAAVEQLKIALTIDPGNKKAEEALQRLTAKRDQEAEKHFNAGMVLKASDPVRASKEFIAALRIRSDYPEAVAELKNLQLETSEEKIQARAKKEAAASVKTQAQDSEEEEEPYLDRAIAYYEDADYPAAIRELQKAKARHPNDPEIQKYLNLSWYNSGISWFKKNEFKKALDSFTKLNANYENVTDYIRKSRQGLKNKAEYTYKLGLKYYREQKLQEAITQWNSVLEIDPEHQKARGYIEKAKKLLEALRNRQ